jgi:hypothetical protein
MSDKREPSLAEHVGLRPMSNTEASARRQTAATIARLRGRLGLLAIVVGNLAAVAGHLDQVRVFIFRYFGMEDIQLLHLAIAIAVSLLLLAGYGVLCTWLYYRYVLRSGLYHRWGFAAAMAFGALALCAVNVHVALPSPPDARPTLLREQADLADVLLSRQADNGGFHFYLTKGPADTQVWTTAQSVYALEIAGMASKARDQIRRSFAYIDRSRLGDTAPSSAGIGACTVMAGDQGWGYVDYSQWGVTEIAAWVTLARIESLNPGAGLSLWTASEADMLARQTVSDLTLLTERQHDDGGWAPIRRTADPTHLRTYSTAMAVWALLAARTNQRVHAMVGDTLDQRITAGARWLLSHYEEESASWYPNPNRGGNMHPFPGLTAQVIYILELASRQFGFIASDAIFKRAREKFLEEAIGGPAGSNLLKRPVSSNERLHDSDRYLSQLPNTVEQMTFLWYPWTLAALAEIETTGLAGEAERNDASKLLSALLKRAPGLWQFTQEDPGLYPSAEGLLGVSLYVNAVDGQPGRAP